MRRLACFMAALVLCLSMAQPVQAASEVYVDNSLGTGDIRIGISDELNLDGDTVLPGDEIDYSVVIGNKAEPAWIRVRITYLPDWLGIEDVMIADGWEPYGGYYYYKDIIPSGGSVEFIQGISIPYTIGNELQGASFDIRTSAEAVQSEHFEPEFGTDDPWFGTVIETCVDSDPYDPGTTDTQSFEVVYEGGSKGLVKTGEDFFANWDRLMPGDAMTGTVEISNKYMPVTIYFRTENIVDGTSGESDDGSDSGLDGDSDGSRASGSDLLAQLDLRIENVGGDGRTVIYDGPMSGVASPMSLGDYAVGSGTTLEYTVTMPARLQNAYSLTDTITRWIFSVDAVEYTDFELPKTGGAGTHGHAMAGMACLALASCFLVKRRGGSGHGQD